jgi:general secretion pathway protein K
MHHQAKPRRLIREGIRGVALISVLWLLALLTLLATSAVALSVAGHRSVELYAQALRADSIADSAIRLTLLRLIAAPESGFATPAGQAQTVSLLDATATVTIVREAGKVDLNTADGNLLSAVFAANGWSEEDARAMAARILDWRDPDDVEEPGGAERRDYVAAHRNYAPRNAPFESVDEIRQVLGGERISEELLSAFTIYSHLQTPAHRIADAPVKRALEWAEAHQLGSAHWLSQTDPAEANVSMLNMTLLTGEVVRIRACTNSAGFMRCRLVVARLTGSSVNPLQIFAWQTQM